LEPGTIYMQPANYHLLVEKDKTLALTVDVAVNYSRPSIDVLFESAADVFGQGLIGVILTGANEDGGQGIEAGGITVVQDTAKAEVSAMKQATVDCVEVDHLLPLEKIGLFLVEEKVSAPQLSLCAGEKVELAVSNGWLVMNLSYCFIWMICLLPSLGFEQRISLQILEFILTLPV